MFKHLSLFLTGFLLVAAITGCSTTDPASVEPLGRLAITNGNDALGSRVDLTGVNYILSNASDKVLAPSHEITLVGTINPPSNQDGVEVRATFVHVLGNRAYVGYNKEGEVYAGAVEVIDISDPSHPTVVSQALFDDTDVAALDISPDGSTLLIAGARDIDQTGYSYPAMVEAMT